MPFYDFIQFGEQGFNVLVLLVSAGFSAHLVYGFGTRKSKEMFIGLILLLLVGCQMYFLIQAAKFVPATRFYTYNQYLHRQDCIYSGKGGKRAGQSSEYEDANPCFCNAAYGAICKNVITGQAINGSCPMDGTAKCTSSSGAKIHRYVENMKNCRGGQARLYRL